MNCPCKNKLECFEGDDSSDFAKQLDKIETKKGEWRGLFKCRQCGQYWQIDFHDYRGPTGLIVRINDASNWQNYSDKQERIKYLISKRGISDQECRIYGCSNKRLNGNPEFCAECTYEKGFIGK